MYGDKSKTAAKNPVDAFVAQVFADHDADADGGLTRVPCSTMTFG
jgi:hypothetical protein